MQDCNFRMFRCRNLITINCGIAEFAKFLARASGYTALDGFQTDRPDLAILDTNMPRIDGMATLRRLRTHELTTSRGPFSFKKRICSRRPSAALVRSRVTGNALCIRS